MTYDSRRCLLFIDGEFWGAYDIIEKPSDYYFQTNYGVPKENVVMMKNYEIEEGEETDLDEFKAVNEYCKNHDMKQKEHYDYVANKIDIESITAHYIVGIYLGIWDWPNYNFLVWKYKGEKIEGNVYSDGKWRFGSFDFDWSVGASTHEYGDQGYSYDYWPKFDGKKSGYPTFIFSSLLQNEEYKKYFIERMEYFADEVFSPEKMGKILDDVENNYLDYLSLSFLRWYNFSKDQTLDYKDFIDFYTPQAKEAITKMREFFNQRKQYALQQTKNYLGMN